jgi:hypothetical protein
MGYQFAGFFALAETPVLQDALATWPGCRGRVITEPFYGIGVAVPEHGLTYGDPDGEGEAAQELAYTLEDTLPEWSRRYLATRFVFLRTDCFGGTCFYWGYVCQNGVIQEQARDITADGVALNRLVRALGVELDAASSYFAPFRRGYFDTT